MSPDNPYWDAVKDKVTPGEFSWEPPCIQRWRLDAVERGLDPDFVILDRQEFVSRYSWTVPDPDSVDFVAKYAENGLVDPMAGTGYWAYILEQAGVDVVSYDLHPGDNPWHLHSALHTDVIRMNAVQSVKLHPDRTLLLAWPPYSETIGERTVQAYPGDRVIYMGEGSGGCTGTDALHRRFDRRWEEIDEHIPIQWWGLHDRITVYQRRGRSRSKKLRR